MNNTSIQAVKTWGSLVKFSHSVFALPFALAMIVIASERAEVSLLKLVFLVIAIVSARTASMAWNRLIDLEIDRINPRTANRELPAGAISKEAVVRLIILSSLIFFSASFLLGMQCLVLAPFVLLMLLGYSLTKRFTPFSHLVLGLCLAAAPGGVWYALVGTIETTPIILMTGVLAWVMGFDILYSLQDEKFDRANGLFSIPSKFGTQRAFLIAAYCHTFCLITFVFLGNFLNFGVFYFLGISFFGGFLLRQHIIARRSISEIDAQFFLNNGYASLIFLIATVFGKY